MITVIFNQISQLVGLFQSSELQTEGRKTRNPPPATARAPAMEGEGAFPGLVLHEPSAHSRYDFKEAPATVCGAGSSRLGFIP